MSGRLSLTAVLLLAACTTPEFRAARAACTAEWLQAIPPVYERQIVTRTRLVERPTGQISCRQDGERIRCIQHTTFEPVHYPVLADVDIHAPRRDAEIAACAARSCEARFGSADCRPAG